MKISTNGTRPEVLIAHSAYWTGIARLPAVLSDAGAKVTVMCPPGSLLGWTRFAERRITASPDLFTFVDELRQHLAERSYRWVILADDDVIVALSRYADDPLIAPILPCASPNAIPMMASKTGFLDACRAAGLPIPLSRTVRTLDEARSAAEAIGYPVMLKQINGCGGVGIKKIDHLSDLEGCFESFADGQPLTLERFVVGRAMAATILYDRGTPLCWYSYYKEKRWPGEFGPSAVRRVMTHPRLGAIAKDLGTLTGVHGFVVLCFVHDEERDDLALLEANFRPGTGMHFRGPIRRMFADALRSLLIGESYERQRTPGEVNRLIHMFPQDVQRAIAERDVRGMLGLLSGAVLQDLPYDDPRLLCAHLRSLF